MIDMIPWQRPLQLDFAKVLPTSLIIAVGRW
jgi:hypothetical protein